MNLQDKLTRYIDAGYPIIYISSYEELKIDSVISEIAGNRKLLEWNGADGLVNFDTKASLLGNKMPLDEALAYLSEDAGLDNHILVMKDSYIYLSDEYPTVTALLKKICHKILKGDIETTILIVSQIIRIPKEIEKFVIILLPLHVSRLFLEKSVRNTESKIQRQNENYSQFKINAS